DHTVTSLEPEISAQVRSLDPDLAWELAPGRTSKHALCVTGGGVAELRSLAERVVRTAPSADETWEYRPARAADPANALRMKLEIGGFEVELSTSKASVTVDTERLRVDVRLFNPRFVQMSQELRGHVAFLQLDWLLGEDDVERWLGLVESVVD